MHLLIEQVDRKFTCENVEEVNTISHLDLIDM